MAEFLTIDLAAITKDQKSFSSTDEQSNAKNIAQSHPAKRDPKKITNWAKELEDRLAENTALSANDRQSDYDVEAQFFKDYFTYGEASWDADYAEQLISLGEPLKKAIKVLGFDKNINPILGFIENPYVLKNLLLPKLLNANTFKAIYTAVSKKLIVHSEFFTENDYNIIYCQDLYRKPLDIIIKYLTIQKAVLSPTATVYTRADQNKNKKVFFELSGISNINTIMKKYPAESAERYKKLKAAIDAIPVSARLPSARATSTKLNDLKLINVLISKTTDIEAAIKGSNDEVYAGSASELARALTSGAGNTNAQIFAAIQYLSNTTDIIEAKEALANNTFKTISMADFITVSARVTKIMKAANLPKSEVRTLIALLLSKLKRS